MSIAALRLGARSAVGVDIDPKAEDMVRENGAYNGMTAPQLLAFTGDVARGFRGPGVPAGPGRTV